MPLLIKNGEIVTADSRYHGRHLRRKTKRSPASGSDLDVPPDTEVIDASGKFVFPGFIDPHVHIYLPFMATFAKDTHQTASVAALVGGTTTYIEMCCPSRMDDALEGYRALEDRKPTETAPATTPSTCLSPSGRTKPKRNCARSSATASPPSKSFSPTRAFSAWKTASCIPTLRLARSLGVTVTAHCENAELVSRLQAKLAGGRKNRAGVARAEPARVGRSRRHSSLRDIPRKHRRNRVRRSSVLRARTTGRRGSKRARREARRSNPFSRISSSTKRMQNGPAWKA